MADGEKSSSHSQEENSKNLRHKVAIFSGIVDEAYYIPFNEPEERTYKAPGGDLQWTVREIQRDEHEHLISNSNSNSNTMTLVYKGRDNRNDESMDIFDRVNTRSRITYWKLNTERQEVVNIIDKRVEQARERAQSNWKLLKGAVKASNALIEAGEKREEERPDASPFNIVSFLTQQITGVKPISRDEQERRHRVEAASKESNEQRDGEPLRQTLTRRIQQRGDSFSSAGRTRAAQRLLKLHETFDRNREAGIDLTRNTVGYKYGQLHDMIWQTIEDEIDEITSNNVNVNDEFRFLEQHMPNNPQTREPYSNEDVISMWTPGTRTVDEELNIRYNMWTKWHPEMVDQSHVQRLERERERAREEARRQREEQRRVADMNIAARAAEQQARTAEITRLANQIRRLQTTSLNVPFNQNTSEHNSSSSGERNSLLFIPPPLDLPSDFLNEIDFEGDERNKYGILMCPITMEIMTDPVIAASGHTYQRQAIEQHFRSSNNDRDPLTNKELPHKYLVPNMVARQIILNIYNDWVAKKKSKQDEPSEADKEDESEGEKSDVEEDDNSDDGSGVTVEVTTEPTTTNTIDSSSASSSESAAAAIQQRELRALAADRRKRRRKEDASSSSSSSYNEETSYNEPSRRDTRKRKRRGGKKKTRKK